MGVYDRWMDEMKSGDFMWIDFGIMDSGPLLVCFYFELKTWKLW